MILSAAVSFPVVGLDLFLRTAPAQFSAQVATQMENWVTDSLMAVPLFAAGIWAGDRIADLGGLGPGRGDVLKRALVISLAMAVALTPAWFEIAKIDNPARDHPKVAPLPHGGSDVYWVGAWAIVPLVCTCLVPAAFWAGRWIGRLLPPRLPRRAAARMAVPGLLVGAVPVLAWLLHQAAEHAYASQVYYTSAGMAGSAAPYAFAYQAAHALQDGLAGQAIGLPVAAVALLWAARRPHDRNSHQPAEI